MVGCFSRGRGCFTSNGRVARGQLCCGLFLLMKQSSVTIYGPIRMPRRPVMRWRAAVGMRNVHTAEDCSSSNQLVIEGARCRPPINCRAHHHKARDFQTMMAPPPLEAPPRPSRLAANPQRNEPRASAIARASERLVGPMDEGALEESSSEEGSSLDEPSWVSWFCMLRNHEFFCEVDPAFVQDRFNLYGLKEVVGPLYGEAMTMILGYAPTGAQCHAARATCSGSSQHCVHGCNAERGCTQLSALRVGVARLEASATPQADVGVARASVCHPVCPALLARECLSSQKSSWQIHRNASTRCSRPPACCTA